MNRFRVLFRRHRWWLLVLFVAAACGYPTEALPPPPAEAKQGDPSAAPWLLGKGYHVPSEYTNQESGYFSIIEGNNGKVYVGTAKYGVNSFLVEFNPMNGVMQMVVDVH